MSTEKLDKVYVTDNIDGRRSLVVDGRFRLSWSQATLNDSPEPVKTAFFNGFMGLMQHMRREVSDDSHEQALARAARLHGVMAFSAVMNVDGCSVVYDDRDERYTNVGGRTVRESIVATDSQTAFTGGIPNPLNVPDVR